MLFEALRLMFHIVVGLLVSFIFYICWEALIMREPKTCEPEEVYIICLPSEDPEVDLICKDRGSFEDYMKKPEKKTFIY